MNNKSRWVSCPAFSEFTFAHPRVSHGPAHSIHQLDLDLPERAAMISPSAQTKSWVNIHKSYFRAKKEPKSSGCHKAAIDVDILHLQQAGTEDTGPPTALREEFLNE